MITVRRCFDKESITCAAVECFHDIVEDNTDYDCIDIDVDADCWLGFYAHGDCLGYIQFSPYNRTTLDFHAYIYKQHRRYSIECGKLAIKWFKEQSPSMYKKLISQVPSCYRHIRRYAFSIGFKQEGVWSKSFTKDGKLHDLWLFGFERGVQ